MESIIEQCFINNGYAFDAEHMYFQDDWSKKYYGKEGLFGKKWIYKETLFYDRVEQTEQVLSKLPKGISYTRTDSITQTLPEKPEAWYSTGYENYETTFQIHVSASYSQTIVRQNNGRKFVVLSKFDKKTLQDAEVFKEKVWSTHPEILEPLFTKGYSKSLILTNESFTDFDCRGISFKYVNMKPLQNESQRLGLILALAEYAEKRLSNDEIAFIKRWGDGGNSDYDGIGVSIRKIKNSPTHLNDW